MEMFSNFYKLVSLLISDRLSSMLATNFDMKNLETKESLYSSFIEDVPKFAFVGLFKYKSRGLLVFIDAKIVYLLSNRLFGGQGVIEKKPSPVFTFSEEYFGKELLSWFSAFFADNGIDVSFLRVEHRVQHIHYFFPDEAVITATMKCKMNDDMIGNISICHPKQFVEEEPLICTV
jgi:flagellar motor switch protein FliM